MARTRTKGPAADTAEKAGQAPADGYDGSAPLPDEQLLLIEDVEHPANEEILKQARKVRKASVKESEAREAAGKERLKLMDLLKQHKIGHWARGDFDVTYTLGQPSVTVKKRKKPKGGDGAADGPDEDDDGDE